MRQSFETLAFVATPTSDDVIDEQRVWSVKECAAVFASTVAQLAQQLAKEGDNGMLVWDKVTLQHGSFCVKRLGQFNVFFA